MPNSEATFISALLQSGDEEAINRHAITADLFDIHREAFVWIFQFQAKYGRLPQKAAFIRRFRSMGIYKNSDVDAAADELKQHWAKRILSNLIDNSVDSILANDIAKTVENISMETLKVQAVLQSQPDDFNVIEDWKRVLDDVMLRIEKVKQTGHSGIPTGFPTLDMLTGGLGCGWFNVISARLGQGKTWTMVKMAVTAALHGDCSLYYTLEQSETQISMRTHSLLSKALGSKEIFNNTDLQRGSGFDLREYKRFLESMEEGIDGRLIVNGARRERVTPLTVASGIERNEPDIVFIDYITLMGMRGDGGWQSVAALSGELQQLAQRYGIPIVVGAQDNRSGEVARSDTIGWDADLRIRVEQKSRSVLKMSVEKFRHGPGGDHWHTEFKPGKGIFEECTMDRATELMDRDEEQA